MLTNKQLLIIVAGTLAAIALILGCPIQEVVRALALMLGMGV